MRFPVVSIGSLSAGGSGKTPLAIALAQALTRHGIHVDVLSRGYGRKSRAALRVDPNGSAEEFGDEPLLIAREAGVPVYVAAQRYDAGRMAEAAFQDSTGLRVHLLDDGFQHRQLHRDVNILLMDGLDLDDHLLPGGNLREPLSAMQRATVIAIPAATPSWKPGWIARAGEDLCGCCTGAWRFRPWRGPLWLSAGLRAASSFLPDLRRPGLHLASRIAFPDHHIYKVHDLDCVRDAVRGIGATGVITTEKDRVRLGELGEPLALKTARLRTEIEDEDGAVAGILKALGC